jgi:putative phosphoesterase
VKVGLIADTQGSYDIDALLHHVAGAFNGVDEIWHAGDWGYPEVLAGLKKLGRLVVVNGNAPEDAHYPTTIEGTIGRWRVGMIHNLDARRQRWTHNFDVVIHGHTHRWRDEVIGRTRFINPGTATRPQFGGVERTMAILDFGTELVVQKLELPKFQKRAAI